MDYKSALWKLLDNMRKADPERLARLEEMGYDTSKINIHGGEGGIKEFIPNKTWNNKTKAVFFTDDPDFSSHFAEGQGGANYPVFLKKEKVYDPHNPKHQEIILNRPGDENSKKLATYTTPQNWQEIETGSDVIKDAGFSGAKIKESYIHKDKGIQTPENLFLFEPEQNVKSIWAKGMAKKGLMTGAVAMDPLQQIGDLVNVYRTNQEKVADAITKQVTQPFGEADELQKTMMRFALDPLNVVEGPAAIGLTGLEMMGKKND